MNQAMLPASYEVDARPFPLAPALLIFGMLAVLGNAFGVVLRYPEVSAAVLFPPYALLTAALVVSPRRDWLWYILVGSVAHALAHWSHFGISWIVFADVGNIARALVATIMLRYWFGGAPRLDTILAVALFVVSAVLVAPAVGATIGAANVVLHGASPVYWLPWTRWFMSNALTGLTMLPSLLAAVVTAARWRERDGRSRVVEAVLLAAALSATCVIAFALPRTRGWNLAVPLYAPVPILIWAALRFGPGGASLAVTAVAVATIWSADRGMGPFLSRSPDENLVAIQVYLVLSTVPTLCIAAVASGRQSVVQLYRALLASLQDQVAILDAHGVVLQVNESWRRFAAGTRARPFDRVRAGEDYVAACRAEADRGDVIAGRTVAGVTGVLERRQPRFEVEYADDHDGLHEWYTMSAERLERPDGGVVVKRADVTARRLAQIEIEEQRRQVSHLARVAVLGQLSGALAHELSQPLASILNNAEAARKLLQMRPINLDELRAIVQDIVTEDRRAGQVMHRLRALLKRGETRLLPIEPGELVREVLELAHAEMITRRVKASALVQPGLPPVLGDRVQLQQVLMNLILNACEAMGGVARDERTLSLTVRLAPANDVQFSLRDAGPGIPPALITRLFEPFVTTKPEGLGLGLSISRTIVAAHGGRLWAENNVDRGATVHCLLASAPLETAPDASHRGAECAPPLMVDA